MSKETSNPLIDLSELSKPAVVLVEKISEGIGGIAAPWQIERVAKAKIEAAHSAAEVARIEAHSEIEVADLRQRAAQRRIEEDTRHQKNMEDITAKAIPHLNEEAKPDAMEDDWVANFFDKSRIVSDSEMQSLWARVLAGEANTPGTYSKRTVNLLAGFDKSDAQLFTKLCGFGWDIGIFIPLVFDPKSKIYIDNGINFYALEHLESIGLVQFRSDNFVLRFPLNEVSMIHFNGVLRTHYYGKLLQLDIPMNSVINFNIGQILLTRMGEELAPICGSKPVEGFYEYIKNRWSGYLPTAEKH